MDFGSAFSFAFQDQDWLKKVGIAALVFLIPVVGPIILMGWGLEITRRVINSDPVPLPGWDDFGSFLSKGFQMFVVTLAFMLPLILVISCGQGLTFGLVASTGRSSNSDTMGSIAAVISLCMSCFAILLGLAAGFILPVAQGRLAATGELGAAFRFNELLALLRAAPGPYLMVILGVALASMVLSSVGTLICGVGLLFTSAYTTALSGHLAGQAYNAAQKARAGSM